mmetsp:Transcript_12623/g.50466  ORF Transcript_12623/g.50466 Transcript_12623/m.50466 type:complete len:259 (-) Transcript_12623:891-1667(-)
MTMVTRVRTSLRRRSPSSWRIICRMVGITLELERTTASRRWPIFTSVLTTSQMRRRISLETSSDLVLSTVMSLSSTPASSSIFVCTVSRANSAWITSSAASNTSALLKSSVSLRQKAGSVWLGRVSSSTLQQFCRMYASLQLTKSHPRACRPARILSNGGSSSGGQVAPQRMEKAQVSFLRVLRGALTEMRGVSMLKTAPPLNSMMKFLHLAWWDASAPMATTACSLTAAGALLPSSAQRVATTPASSSTILQCILGG